MRSGKGFAYRDPNGATIARGAERDRIAALAVPPAWTDVWIAPRASDHIQATGVDAAGRLQYIYHPAWRDRMRRPVSAWNWMRRKWSGIA